uniref:Uncharacterized protein n=1 Tax=Oryza nivara TaxID=4536 RepID=A0A0E0IDT8_ORYNI
MACTKVWRSTMYTPRLDPPARNAPTGHPIPITRLTPHAPTRGGAADADPKYPTHMTMSP